MIILSVLCLMVFASSVGANSIYVPDQTNINKYVKKLESLGYKVIYENYHRFRILTLERIRESQEPRDFSREKWQEKENWELIYEQDQEYICGYLYCLKLIKAHGIIYEKAPKLFDEWFIKNSEPDFSREEIFTPLLSQ